MFSYVTGIWKISMHFLLLVQFPGFYKKIENENAEGILIVPAFVTQAWFPRLLGLLIKPPVKLPKSRESLYFPFRRKEQPLPNMKLQIFSSTSEKLRINPDMEHILENGWVLY